MCECRVGASFPVLAKFFKRLVEIVSHFDQAFAASCLGYARNGWPRTGGDKAECSAIVSADFDFVSRFRLGKKFGKALLSFGGGDLDCHMASERLNLCRL